MMKARKGKFSPRARGCSALEHHENISGVVFPACAGMFLSSSLAFRTSLGFPRVRGDVPDVEQLIIYFVQFSPRARGCSSRSEVNKSGRPVFPACAGMFRIDFIAPIGNVGFPRVRGDVPTPSSRCTSVCSVFPACAGMFRV